MKDLGPITSNYNKNMSSLQEGASVPRSLGYRKRGQHHYRECEMYGRMADAQMKDPEAFLGYVNYHREHIKSFAEIAAPLYTLKGPKTKFIWTQNLFPLKRQ